GSTTLSRVRTYTKSDNAVLDRREFVFGQLQPGEKRTWIVPIKIPRYVPSRRDDVTLKWEDDSGDQLEEARAETDIAELPRPAFAWSYQIVGNDGLLHKGEKGETAEIIVDVKNVGTGTAFDAYAALRNLSEDRINVKKGRTKLGPLKPGEMKSATFVLEVKKPLEDTVPVSAGWGQGGAGSEAEFKDRGAADAERGAGDPARQRGHLAGRRGNGPGPPDPGRQRQRRERDARSADLHPARERLPEGVLPH